MEKKLKMWIAVGVVVIIVLSIILASIFIFTLKDDYEYSGRIDIEISENETAWIITVTDIIIKDIETGVKETGGNLSGGFTDVNIHQDNKSWTRPLSYFEYESDEFGITFVDLDNNSCLDIGDKIIFNKSGGTEYIPNKGDYVSVSYWMPHDMRLKSNGLELP